MNAEVEASETAVELDLAIEGEVVTSQLTPEVAIVGWSETGSDEQIAPSIDVGEEIKPASERHVAQPTLSQPPAPPHLSIVEFPLGTNLAAFTSISTSREPSFSLVRSQEPISEASAETGTAVRLPRRVATAQQLELAA